MDDDDIEEYAELWGVEPEDVEALFDVVNLELLDEVPFDELGRPDVDYMDALAEDLDIDVSDLYDMYYGYTEAA